MPLSYQVQDDHHPNKLLSGLFFLYYNFIRNIEKEKRKRVNRLGVVVRAYCELYSLYLCIALCSAQLSDLGVSQIFLTLHFTLC